MDVLCCGSRIEFELTDESSLFGVRWRLRMVCLCCSMVEVEMRDKSGL